MSNHSVRRPRVPRTIHRIAVPILLFWVALAAIPNIVVPQLEEVGRQHNVGLSSPEAPSYQAFKHIGKVFHEFDTDSSAMIVLEGDKPLGADAHKYYDALVHKLEQDKKHVQHIQDFWGDSLTAAGSQSTDGKAAYVQLFLAGAQGEALANESVDAVRATVDQMKPPPGVKAYLTGAAPLIADQFTEGSKGSNKVTALTIAVIAVMLFFVYRSFATTALVLITVLIEMAAARGFVAFLGSVGILGLSTYATNLLTLLVIAAGTDYAIFFVGRYQEARSAGEEREDAYYSMYSGTAHVVLGSGLTVASAVACLSFHPAALFPELGHTRCDRHPRRAGGLAHPGPGRAGDRRPFRSFRPQAGAANPWLAPDRHRDRPVARANPGGVHRHCPDRPAGPARLQDQLRHPPLHPGYRRGQRGIHRRGTTLLPRSRLEPELLMIEADHDLRNPADMLVLDKVAKGIFHIPGIAQVQTITRPLGTPLDHSSIAFQISQQSVGQVQNLKYQSDRAHDLLRQSQELDKTIGILQQQYALQQQLAGATHEETQKFHETLAIISEVRDKLANFDDFFRPIHSYFYWEKHCYDIPACFALRNTFEAIDSIDQLSEKFEDLVVSLDKLDTIQPQLVGLIPPQIASQEVNRELTLKNFATNLGINKQSEVANDNPAALGQAFDKSKNDDLFYLPPEVFDNPDFKRGLKLFLSPDGKAARMIITHEGDPAEPAAISRVEPIKLAAHEAVKGTPLANSSFYLGGTASTYKDIERHGELRHLDRRHRLVEPDPADHDAHHPEPGGRDRHRRHGGVVVGRVVRPVGAAVAVPTGHRIVLGGTGFGGHPAAGRRIGLQPAADLPVQGRDSRRTEDRHHPRDGRLRLGGDRRGSGVRRDDVRLRLQRSADPRSDRHHDRPRSAVRHADRAFVHDALDRHLARPVVLVAAAGAPAPGQLDAAALRIASRRSSAAAVGRPGRKRRPSSVALIDTAPSH